MTNNTYSVKEAGQATNKNTTFRFQILLLTMMCIVLLIVSFIAFLKIENNLHAFIVFAVGSLLNGLIFVNGINQIKG